MGRCYEFAAEIEAGCDHAMRVSDEGGACECPSCGARCEGRFDLCASVLERPGYVPANAPGWAAERTVPVHWAGVTQSARMRRTLDPEPVIDLTASHDPTFGSTAIGDAAHDLRTSLKGATADVITRVCAELEPELARDTIAKLNDDHRAPVTELARVADVVRPEIQRMIAQQLASMERLAAEVDRLAEQADADRRTLRAVVEGLDRLAKQIGRLR